MAKAFFFEVFLNAVRGVHGTSGGTRETSNYTALNNLLDGIGHVLKQTPKRPFPALPAGPFAPNSSPSPSSAVWAAVR